MCGIVGCFDVSGRPVDPEVLARMTGTLVHRGPDSCGSFSEAGIAFGFRFQINAHLQTDLLMIVLTFGILLERFHLSALRSTGAVAC
jgi:hypothetical protein